MLEILALMVGYVLLACAIVGTYDLVVWILWKIVDR